MGTFNYAAPDSRFGATIADLLSHQSDAASRSAENIAALQARGADQSARAWSGAVQNIGGSLAEALDPVRRQTVKLKAQEQQLEAQRLGMQNQQMQSGLDEKQRQHEGEAALSKVLAATPLKEDGTYDEAAIAKGIDPKYAAYLVPQLQHIGAVNQAVLGAKAKDRAEFTAAIGGILQSGVTPIMADAALVTATSKGILSREQSDKYRKTIAEDPSQAPMILRSLAGFQKPEVSKEGDTARDPLTNDVLFTNPKPEKPTEAEIAMKAAGGDPAKAMSLLKPPPAPRPISEQLLEAVAKGDQSTIDNISKTMRTEAAAKQDPATAAMAMQLKNLSAREAQARLDALGEKNQPVNVAPDVQTTISGKKYLDVSTYTGAERNKAVKAAGEHGITVVSKEQANAIQEIDNARGNQRDIMAQIEGLLPKSPVGRAAALVGTPLAKMFQTDDQKAAFASWRTAAIQTLRATAGSKGLRINQAEIAQAIENDIPRLTDTVGVAQQKVKNINKMLDNAENSILVRDRSMPPVDIGPQQPPALSPALQGLANRP